MSIILLQNTINNKTTPRTNVVASLRNIKPLTNNKNEQDSVKAEIKQLKDKLSTVMAELSNEKSNNMMLMKCQELECKEKLQNEYDVKLKEKNKELESILLEKNDLLQQYL